MIPSLLSVILYVIFIVCGVAIMYSLMICLSATSIWLGRNQTLYNFWFYITNFSRYPMEMYNRGWGQPLYGFFTFIVPVLLVVNVPATIACQTDRASHHRRDASGRLGPWRQRFLASSPAAGSSSGPYPATAVPVPNTISPIGLRSRYVAKIGRFTIEPILQRGFHETIRNSFF